jgi:hypothetical protein
VTAVTGFKPGDRVYLKSHIEEYESGAPCPEPVAYEVIYVEPGRRPFDSPFARVIEPVEGVGIDVPLDRLIHASQ